MLVQSLLHARREPEVGLGPAEVQKTRWHDANHLDCLVIERDRASDDFLIAVEELLPEPMAQDGHAARSRLVVLRRKRAPLRGHHAKEVEVFT